MSSQYAGRKRRQSSADSGTLDKSTTRMKTNLSNSTTGAQHNNSGTGKQYNNSDSGTQYNAEKIEIVNKEKENFLADLRVTDPRDDKVRIQRTKGDLLVDSYRWIIDHDDFHQWRAERRLLWIKGGPGKGKTMLLCGMIDELVAMGYTSTFFFFCQATDARLNNATSVLRGLLYLMLDRNPSLLNLLRDKYDRAGADIFKDVNSWDVLCKMILSVVSHESLGDVILIIDALDECISGLDQLISFIIDLTAHAKVIASSRPELRIDRGLAAALEDTKVYLSLELNEDVISAAVNSYICHKVERLAVLKGFDEGTKTYVRDYLAAKANSTFLWVALVYEQLADNRVAKRHAQRKLQEFPPGLDSLYGKILDQTLGSLDAEDCKQVLSIVSIVSRPLALAELASLLEHVECLEDIVEECGSLLSVKKGIIYFVHQSAKDFLVRQAERIMPLGVGHSHNLLLSKLLRTMSSTLRRNIYHIHTNGIPLEDIRVPKSDPLASVRYACAYWTDHFIEDQVQGNEFDEVYDFITRHFLHWLEALGLLQSITEGILSMSKLQRIIESSDEPLECKLLVRDAVRFIRYFRVAIETDPMQVYVSALVFSPSRSIIRRLFLSEEPTWPMKPQVDERWSPCLQTFEGHGDSVHLVAFFAHESMIASASDDVTIRIWNATTGHCVRTLETEHITECMAFSTDGVTLAAASDSSIELWNTITGHCVHKLKTHNPVAALAFFDEGLKFPLGASEDVVELRDTGSGQRMLTTCSDGHCCYAPSAAAPSAAFSGDGSLVARVRKNNTVEVWQTTTGVCLKIVDHTAPLRSVALSRDGTHVASASRNEAKVCNLTTGDCFDLPRDKALHGITTSGISSNGAYLALGMESGHIHVWDTTTNRIKYVLPGHDEDVNWVVFSEDGELLASASTDCSVKLWSLTIDESHKLVHSPTSDAASNTSPDPGLGRRKSSHMILKVVKESLLATGEGQLNTEKGDWTPAFKVNQTAAIDPQHIEFSLSDITAAGRLWIARTESGSYVWDMKNAQFVQKFDSRFSISCVATFVRGEIHFAWSEGNRIFISKNPDRGILRKLEVCNCKGMPVVFSCAKEDGKTHECERKTGFGIQMDLQYLRFSDSGYQLYTEFGSIDLDATEASGTITLSSFTVPPYVENFGPYDYISRDSWVMKHGRLFLWLPPEYRPSVSTLHGATLLALGYRSGRVRFMRFA